MFLAFDSPFGAQAFDVRISICHRSATPLGALLFRVLHALNDNHISISGDAFPCATTRTLITHWQPT